MFPARRPRVEALGHERGKNDTVEHPYWTSVEAGGGINVDHVFPYESNRGHPRISRKKNTNDTVAVAIAPSLLGYN